MSRSARARYLFALVATLIGTLATVALLEVADEGIYAPLLGAVVLTALYGGLGPSVVAIALGWGLGLWLVVQPRRTLQLRDADDFSRWWITLGVAAISVFVVLLLRSRERQAMKETESAQDAMQEVRSLQQVSVALSAAVASTDVADVLATHLGRILGAQGVALGLLDGDQLVIVDPSGLATRAQVPDGRLEVQATTLIGRAARQDELVFAHDRLALDREFPDSAGILPSDVRSAMAIPVRSADRAVIGAIGILFDHEHDRSMEVEALAQVVADLAGTTLERAGLYERERESRQALDRILQVSPRFLADDPGSVVAAVCREARVTFGADYGVLWRVGESSLELLCVDPPVPGLAEDTTLKLTDFPMLRQALEELGTSFVPDVLETTTGEGRAFVSRLGIRSSLRAPVVIAGTSEMVLSISWQVVVSPPEPATLALVRRFADQAGLALEQLERRRAQAEAVARAESTRRLHEVTAALSTAATPVDVSNTCLEHALESIGAEAGFVVLTGAEGSRIVELVSDRGFDDDELAGWKEFSLDDDVPFSRAIGSGEPVWALTADEMSEFSLHQEARSTGWIAIPLVTTHGARGAIHISLREPRELGDAERQWLVSMVTQCGQALERAGLFSDEQRSRQRAEQLQSMTARLSNALTSSDVARVVVGELAEAFGAAAVALAGVTDGQVTGDLTTTGSGEELLAPLLDVASDTPGGRATRSLRSVLIGDRATLLATFPTLAAGLAANDHETYLALPLVAARRANGLLLASWERPNALVAEDRAVVEALAGQAAQALDRAGRYEVEQGIAETLQRSVLPDSLPRVQGVELAARYLPGSSQLDVGGDWFDALTLADGKLGLVVGDVVGKGVQAAASMAQLRNAIRAFSMERLKPSSVLARLDRLSADVLDTSFATVIYVILDPETGMCRMSSAGHPPPLVAFPDGRVEFLEEARGLPLGTGLRTKYRQHTVELPAGSVLVLYTDGLVEQRGRSIDDGLEALRAAVRDAPTDPDRLLDLVLETVIGSREREDDIAVLAARVLPVAPRALELQVPASLDSMPLLREAMRVWLSGTSLDRSAAEGVVLATWEAVANAVEHAVDPRESTVRLRAVVDEPVIRVVIEDSGDWAPASGSPDRGFGLRLIDSLVTSVDIARSNGGTTVTLEKELGAEPESTDRTD